MLCKTVAHEQGIKEIARGDDTNFNLILIERLIVQGNLNRQTKESK
ncbi:hypothetical protein Y017_12675 [Alcanivorax sp. 97CO-5]|jgi:hypothetical protein|nr:hypothetical protein Y017_12675 [Alcanivorax sp. 97CO-5]